MYEIYKYSHLALDVTRKIFQNLKKIVRENVFSDGLEVKMKPSAIAEMLKNKCFDIFKIDKEPLRICVSNKVIHAICNSAENEISNLFDFVNGGLYSTFDFMNVFFHVAEQNYTESQTERELTIFLDNKVHATSII